MGRRSRGPPILRHAAQVGPATYTSFRIAETSSTLPLFAKAAPVLPGRRNNAEGRGEHFRVVACLSGFTSVPALSVAPEPVTGERLAGAGQAGHDLVISRSEER